MSFAGMLCKGTVVAVAADDKSHEPTTMVFTVNRCSILIVGA